MLTSRFVSWKWCHWSICIVEWTGIMFILLYWNRSIFLGVIPSCEICSLISNISLLPLTESDVFLPFFTVSQHLYSHHHFHFSCLTLKVLFKQQTHVLSRKFLFFSTVSSVPSILVLIPSIFESTPFRGTIFSLYITHFRATVLEFLLSWSVNKKLPWYILNGHGNSVLGVKPASKCEKSWWSVTPSPQPSRLTVYSPDLLCFVTIVLLTEVTSWLISCLTMK
jgi:hypothetical protein